jgi:hypothetical protein
MNADGTVLPGRVRPFSKAVPVGFDFISVFCVHLRLKSVVFLPRAAASIARQSY